MKKIIMPVIAAVIVISTAISIITYTKSSGYRTCLLYTSDAADE